MSIEPKRVIPVAQGESNNDFPDDLPAPARRALNGAGYTDLDQLTSVTENELLQLHGVGANAIAKLRRALAATGRSLSDDAGS
jgi:hypothetical protein